MVQELKGERFDTTLFEAIDYTVHIHGQKTYNGVATFTKIPLEVISTSILEGDEQARYLETRTEDGIHLINIYAPNGNPVESEKYPYKLRWMEELIKRAQALLESETPFVIGGDYNIIPTPLDAATSSEWVGDALFKPESIDIYRRLIWMGIADAFRVMHPNQPGHYTFWDYQAGCWQRDNGIRIDHFLTCPAITDRIKSCTIDRTPRGWEKPSDHTAVILEFSEQ